MDLLAKLRDYLDRDKIKKRREEEKKSMANIRRSKLVTGYKSPIRKRKGKDIADNFSKLNRFGLVRNKNDFKDRAIESKVGFAIDRDVKTSSLVKEKKDLIDKSKQNSSITSNIPRGKKPLGM